MMFQHQSCLRRNGSQIHIYIYNMMCFAGNINMLFKCSITYVSLCVYIYIYYINVLLILDNERTPSLNLHRTIAVRQSPTAAVLCDEFYRSFG